MSLMAVEPWKLQYQDTQHHSAYPFTASSFELGQRKPYFQPSVKVKKMLSSSLMVCGSQDGLPHIYLHVFVKANVKAATSCQPERKGILPAGLGNDRT